MRLVTTRHESTVFDQSKTLKMVSLIRQSINRIVIAKSTIFDHRIKSKSLPFLWRLSELINERSSVFFRLTQILWVIWFWMDQVRENKDGAYLLQVEESLLWSKSLQTLDRYETYPNRSMMFFFGNCLEMQGCHKQHYF